MGSTPVFPDIIVSQFPEHVFISYMNFREEKENANLEVSSLT